MQGLTAKWALLFYLLVETGLHRCLHLSIITNKIHAVPSTEILTRTHTKRNKQTLSSMTCARSLRGKADYLSEYIKTGK